MLLCACCIAVIYGFLFVHLARLMLKLLQHTRPLHPFAVEGETCRSNCCHALYVAQTAFTLTVVCRAWISDTGMLCCEGGGGPKAALLEKMIAEEQLEHRVHMVGAVPHEQARDVLVCSRRHDHWHTCCCLIHHTNCHCDHHHAFPGHLHQASTTQPQMKPCCAVISQVALS